MALKPEIETPVKLVELFVMFVLFEDVELIDEELDVVTVDVTVTVKEYCDERGTGLLSVRVTLIVKVPVFAMVGAIVKVPLLYWMKLAAEPRFVLTDHPSPSGSEIEGKEYVFVVPTFKV